MSAALIVDRRGCAIDLSSREVMRVRYNNNEVHRVGVRAIRQLVLLGDVKLSSSVVRSCLEAGVDIVLQPRRGRQPTLHLLPVATTGARLRHAQHLHHADSKRRLALAQQLIAYKIAQQNAWLETQGIAAGLERFQAATAGATDIASLMGIEGAASARYFERWSKLWQTPWQFNGRNRRPPRDPVNALMSLSYGLALGYVGRLASRKGLEPALGFVHGAQRERPALALDLLEPLRARIDHWVWQLLNKTSPLTPEHFSNSKADGCRLNKTGRAIYFAHWYRDLDDRLQRPSRDALALIIKTLRQYP